MLFNRYDFTCQLETDASLPYYKGSTFRGVFGRALKKVVCALKQQECSLCILSSQCIYAQVFETQAVPENRDTRIASAPHPFVIEPPLTTETQFKAGSCFDFSLLLMGETNKSIAYFIYAFEQMGRIGIGRKINGRRGQFLLKTVTCNNNTIYSSSDRKLSLSEPAGNLNPAPLQKNQPVCPCIKLILQTPLRLKYGNKLHADLPFHLLVRAMLRRISSLMNIYDKGEPDLDYKGLVKKAYDVETVEKKLSWYDWQRYSFRQDKKMLMGGMTGTITYKGNLGEYLPLIDFCKKVHIGKQTSFGLGKIDTEMIS